MEEVQPKTGKYALKFGVILGVIGVVFTLMLYSQDLHYQIDLKRLAFNILFSLILIVIVGILAMREFKKNNTGLMSFGQGLKIGVGISIISGIIGIIFNYILTEFIDPETTEKAIVYATEMMREAGMSEIDIDKNLEGQSNPSPLRQIGGGLLFSIILGFIGSLIPALILKKSEPAY